MIDALSKFELLTSQVLMLFIEGTTTMRCVGRTLIQVCGNLLHVICKIHELHLAAETIRNCYSEVNALVATTKAGFRQTNLEIPQTVSQYL